MQSELGISGASLADDEPSREDDFIYYLQRGSELLRAGRPEEARAAIETAYTLAPENPKAQNLLGLVYFKLGLLEAAKSIYDQLLEAYPREAPLHVNLGLVLLRQGRLNEAEAALRTAIDIAPDHTRAHCYLGLVLYRRGDLAVSRDHFLKGNAHDFAEKVEAKIARKKDQPSQADMLAAVADSGVENLESEHEPFRQLDSLKDERVVRDEEAWEAKVTHSQEPGSSIGGAVNSLLPVWAYTPLPAPADDSTPPPFPPPEPEAAAPPMTPPAGPPPASDTFVDRVPASEDTTDDVVPVAPQTSTTPSTGDLELPEELMYGSAPPGPSLPPDVETDHVSRISEEMPRGFRAGPGSRARLVMDHQSYLRTSMIVAASGRLSMTAAMAQLQGRSTGTTFGDPSDPMCALEGSAVLILRVPRLAVALRGARDLHVVHSALMGFDAGFEWDNGKVLGLGVVTLRGKGSLLLDTRGPPMLIPVDADTPVHAACDALLAWSDTVRPSPIEGGNGEVRLFRFRGRGYVLVAFPPEDADQA